LSGGSCFDTLAGTRQELHANLTGGTAPPARSVSALLTAGVLLWTAAVFWDLFGTLLWLALSLVTLVCWVRGIIAAAAAAREEDDRAARARGILTLKAAFVPLFACASLAVAITDLPTRVAFTVSRPFLDRAADSPSDDTRFAGVLPASLKYKEQAAVYYFVGTSFPLTFEACGFVRIALGRCAVSRTKPCTDRSKAGYDLQNRPLTWVEMRGFEPLTPSMRSIFPKISGSLRAPLDQHHRFLNIRQRPRLYVLVVTHLVTHPSPGRARRSGERRRPAPQTGVRSSAVNFLRISRNSGSLISNGANSAPHTLTSP